MSKDTLPDNQRNIDEGDTPVLTTTMLDGAGAAIPLANVVTLTLTQWIQNGPPGRPGTVSTAINSRNGQDVKNANNVTVASTSGVVTWQLVQADTTMQSRDQTVTEEKHYFRFDLSYTSGGSTLYASYPDYYVVQRKQLVK